MLFFFRPSRPMSPIPTFEDDDDDESWSDKLPDDEIKNINNDLNCFNDNKKNNSDKIMNINDEDDSVVEIETTIVNNYTNTINDDIHRVQSSNMISLTVDDAESNIPRDNSNDALSEARVTSNITQIAHVDYQSCGLPMNLFTNGYLCLPYLSLPYMDLLGDKNVRGYVVGATNVLFKQKKQLIDVLIEAS